jgi:hypothetical protein
MGNGSSVLSSSATSLLSSERRFFIWVLAPCTAEMAEQHMHEMRQAGFHGRVRSTDATHVILERVLWNQSQAHLGFKLLGAARTYSLTVNHRRRILSSTTGHSSQWNDKTLILFGNFVRGVQEGEFLVTRRVQSVSTNVETWSPLSHLLLVDFVHQAAAAVATTVLGLELEVTCKVTCKGTCEVTCKLTCEVTCKGWQAVVRLRHQQVVDGVVVQEIQRLSMQEFRSRLVEHFDILWQRNENSWPSRCGPRPSFP